MQILTAPSFIEIIKSGYSNCFNFAGRARRAEYWWFVLYNFIFIVAASSIMFLLTYAFGSSFIALTFSLIFFLIYLLHVVILISLAIRRLHDTGRSGWWLLIQFIPLLGGIVLLVFLTNDSLPIENQWGASPKYVV